MNPAVRVCDRLATFQTLRCWDRESWQGWQLKARRMGTLEGKCDAHPGFCWCIFFCLFVFKICFVCVWTVFSL